ncbi:MAG TPA: Tm-1-like ATP-binding domain-containing protein, partial [Pirellulales bacterium]
MPNANRPAVYILATLDTKGVEAAYLADRLRQYGIATRLVDVSCSGEPKVKADIGRDRVFAAAGADLMGLVAGADRGAAVSAAAEGTRLLVAADHARGAVAGVLALG